MIVSYKKYQDSLSRARKSGVDWLRAIDDATFVKNVDQAKARLTHLESVFATLAKSYWDLVELSKAIDSAETVLDESQEPSI